MTVPVGVVVPLACFTVAVNVTGLLSVIAAADETSVVDVSTTAEVTVTVTGFEVDELKLLLPEYVAVTVSVPTGRDVVARLATPPLRVADPSEADPL